MTLPNVIIYCDGACLGNPGPGGYAALLMLKNKNINERVVAGFEISSTNNRMELRAALEGLKSLTKKCTVEIFSDSQYVVRGMNEWIQSWQKNSFKNSQKKPIANIDLWQELLQVSKNHKISWQWVKGHSGNEYNDRVDEIASEQAALAMHQLQNK